MQNGKQKSPSTIVVHYILPEYTAETKRSMCFLVK